MAIGGWDNIAVLKSVDLFPLPACSINSAICAIPDLPKPRLDHSLSLLPGGRLVVCGGRDFDYYLGQFFTLNTCISWAAGESTWTELYTMRCISKTMYISNPFLLTMFAGWPDPFTQPGHHQHLLTLWSCLEGGKVLQIFLWRFCPPIHGVRGQIHNTQITQNAKRL